MKAPRPLQISVFFTLFSLLSHAQIITTTPALPVAGEAVTIYFDATEGNGGLEGYTGDVYTHTGVLTDQSTGSSDWKYVMTDWGENSEETKMTMVSANYYSLEITPSIRDYYGVPLSETITHMAFVFRNSSSDREGKDVGGADVLVEVFQEGLSVSIINPDRNSIIDPGSSVNFEAASSLTADLDLYLNDTKVKSLSDKSISHTFDFDSSGDYWIRVTAEADGETLADSVFVHVKGAGVTDPVPESMRDGINYIDDQTATLVLYAPLKKDVFIIGHFNEWTPNTASRMIKDGERFWITLDGLVPGEVYGFQYLVDGELLIADPYTAMTLDPNDKGIDESTYPGLKPYPSGLTYGITSVLQTNQQAYEWKNADFIAPESQNLVIYELLLRDFIEAHDWKTLTDTLDYFTGLGVNAIELMPVNEFENNESWGYNPSFYFAADKYYGPAGDLKVFIDSCHGRDIAVIIDMVLNHSYGQSPLVQLYFDNATGKVSDENPWYNVDSPNSTYSWGYDFNHKSEDTENFVDSVNHYWLKEFDVDGFRFDFTKGFTNTPGDGYGYDLSRIKILRRMAAKIWEVNENAYVILEHLTDNSEEYALSNDSMLLWGNLNHAYNQATMGYVSDSDFSRISYKERFWNKPALVGYMESHDEERLMYKNLEYGASSESYDIQDRSTALARMELAGVFFFPVPGPKMIWQFGELGYAYSIDYDCRVCPKPIRWDYLEKGVRKRIYQTWSALIDLKHNEPAFASDDFTLELSGSGKRIEINHADMDVRIIGNFDVVNLDVNPAFSETGWWYDFFSGDSLEVSDVNKGLVLEPGKYSVYTTRKLYTPERVSGIDAFETGKKGFHVHPNPGSGTLYLDPLPESSRLSIHNSAGQVVMALELEENQDRVNLASLPAGLYLLSRQAGREPPQYVKVIRE